MDYTKNFKPPQSLADFDVVFYHKGCPDGIAAAFPFWLENKERFVAGFAARDGQRLFYGKGLSHAYSIKREWVEGRTVAFVDICLQFAEIEQVAKYAKYLVVIDHHLSVKREMQQLNTLPNCTAIYDDNFSAAQLAWDYAAGLGAQCTAANTSRPWFIDIIGDGDLHRFSLPDSRALYKAMSKRYKSWEALEELLFADEVSTRTAMVQYGEYALEQDRDPIEQHFRSAVLCSCSLAGAEDCLFLLAECTAFELISAVGAQLAISTGVGVTWYYNFTADTWKLSLRVSENSDINVAALAKRYGGGGHAKSASFYIYGHRCAKESTCMVGVRPSAFRDPQTNVLFAVGGNRRF